MKASVAAVEKRTGCSANMLPTCVPPVKYTTSVTSTALARPYDIMAVNLHRRVYEARAEGDGQETDREGWGVSVYCSTSSSAQQEFFPCFITGHLSIRLRREVESPPDVTSSTFTYNHTEKQHGSGADGQWTAYLDDAV